MDTPMQARMYVADQRGCSQTDAFRSYHTFNYGTYQAEGRQPFGPLRLLNDDTLRAGAGNTMQVDAPTLLLLLPVVGGLEYRREPATGVPVTGFLEPGQAGMLALAAGMSYTLSNPYETEYINVVQIWLTGSLPGPLPAFTQTLFDFTQKNCLLPIFGPVETGECGFIGRYDGRQEGTYRMGEPGTTSLPRRVFVFILKGVFEVANRLLHEKDGLTLQFDGDETIEFEALSNESILILIDLGVGR